MALSVRAVVREAMTSTHATLASAASITFPEASTVSTFPLEFDHVELDVSCVNLSHPLPAIPELISSFAFGVAVPSQSRPLAVMRMTSVYGFVVNCPAVPVLVRNMIPLSAPPALIYPALPS